MITIKRRVCVFLVILLLPLLGIQASNIIEIDRDIQLVHLQDSIFIHVSWHEPDNFDRFPSNGLLIVKNGQGIMVDTPMDNDKTERLTEYIEDNFNIRLLKFIGTLFHDDCIGGLHYLKEKGVESIANSMTIDKCMELDLLPPDYGFAESRIINFHDEEIECRYFGGGHSFDNIVVWLPDQRILFGGCLVRSANATNLGNTKDAVLNEWAGTVQNILQQYKDITLVIPGHGSSGGIELINHTLELLETNGY